MREPARERTTVMPAIREPSHTSPEMLQFRVFAGRTRAYAGMKFESEKKTSCRAQADLSGLRDKSGPGFSRAQPADGSSRYGAEATGHSVRHLCLQVYEQPACLTNTVLPPLWQRIPPDGAPEAVHHCARMSACRIAPAHLSSRRQRGQTPPLSGFPRALCRAPCHRPPSLARYAEEHCYILAPGPA